MPTMTRDRVVDMLGEKGLDMAIDTTTITHTQNLSHNPHLARRLHHSRNRPHNQCLNQNQNRPIIMYIMSQFQGQFLTQLRFQL